MTPSLPQRSALAARIRRRRDPISVAVTTQFLARYTSFAARFGAERAFEKGVADALQHVDVLAAAIEADSPPLLADYTRWTIRVLEARSIEAAFVHENVRQVVDAVVAELDPEDGGLVQGVYDAAQACPEGPEDAPPGRKMFLDRVLRGDRRAALALAEAELRDTGSLLAVYRDLFEATLREVGRLWESNRISVAQEHTATAVIQYLIAAMSRAWLTVPPTRGAVIVAGVEGEHHQLGAAMVADALEVSGFQVRFLGSNVPTVDLVAAVVTGPCAILGLSVTMPAHLGVALDVVDQVRRRLGDRAPAILFGGRAFRSASTLVREVGALGVGADLASSVSLALSLPG